MKSMQCKLCSTDSDNIFGNLYIAQTIDFDYIMLTTINIPYLNQEAVMDKSAKILIYSHISVFVRSTSTLSSKSEFLCTPFSLAFLPGKTQPESEMITDYRLCLCGWSKIELNSSLNGSNFEWTCIYAAIKIPI